MTTAAIGYARVSTADQNIDLQLDALKHCARIFTDTGSGKAINTGLRDALAFLRRGDTLTVWKLDRLGRSMRGLLDLALDLETRGIHLRSITDAIDTTTPAGRFFFHMAGAMAQMERELIAERTRAGLEAARARGRRPGRPRAGPFTGKKLAMASALFAAGADVPTVAAALGVHPATVYRKIPARTRQIDFIAAAHEIQPE